MTGLYLIAVIVVIALAVFAQYAARRHEREQQEVETDDTPLVVLRMNAFGEEMDRVWAGRER